MDAGFASLHESLVEWVYDRSDDGAAGDVSITEFANEHRLDLAGAVALLRYCKGKGLLDDQYSLLGTPVANLTPAGVQWVEDRRHRRADPAARVAGARSGLLTWLWQRKHDGGAIMPIVNDILGDPESLFEGERLTPDEIDRAAAHLHAKGLITGITVAEAEGPVQAEITAEGEDCVESYGADTGAYARRTESGPVFHIGTNTGNIAASSSDFTQSSTSQVGFDPSYLLSFARLVEQLAPSLAPDDTERAKLLTVVQQLEQGASTAQPDHGRLRTLSQRVIISLRGLAHSPEVQRLAIEAGEMAIHNAFG